MSTNILAGLLSVLLFFFTTYPHTQCTTQFHSHTSSALWAIPTTLISSALASVGIAWFHAPKKFEPTMHNIAVTTLIPTYNRPNKKAVDLSAVKRQLRTQQHTAVCIDLGQQTIAVHAGAPTTTEINGVNKQTKTAATPKNLLKHTVDKKQCAPLYLVSPGFMGKRPQKYAQEAEPETGIDQAAHFIEHGIINGPCVTFNYNDERRVFNFAQKTDLACLQTAYNAVKNNDIVLVGTCRGAATALSFLTQLQEKDFTQIKAVILESPALCLDHLAAQVAHTYVGWLPKAPTIIHGLFRFWFPSYKPRYPSFLAQLHKLPAGLPILIAHLEGDKVIAYSDIVELTQQLRDSGHQHVYVAIVRDQTITHARLSKIPAFQHVCNAFLRTHGITHDPQLAQLGKPLLEQARSRALHITEHTQLPKNADHVVV